MIPRSLRSWLAQLATVNVDRRNLTPLSPVTRTAAPIRTEAAEPDLLDRVFPPEQCDWSRVHDRPAVQYGDWSTEQAS